MKDNECSIGAFSPEYESTPGWVKTAQEHFLSGSSQDAIPGSDEWYMPVKLARMPKEVRRYFVRQVQKRREGYGFFISPAAAARIGLKEGVLAIKFMPLDKRGRTKGDPEAVGLWDSTSNTVKEIDGMTNEEATRRLREVYASFPDGTGLHLRNTSCA